MTEPSRSFARYVAIGDSSTAGLDDPHPGGGYHGWANRLPCLASIGSSIAIGVLRMMADKHYFTDVLMGGLVGFGAGYVWPSLVRYLGDAEGDDEDETNVHTRAAVVPWGDSTTIGVAVIGENG